MPSTAKAALGRGKRATPEHQSARTVPAARPHDPPSDGNDYEVLASFPQMWQRSRGRNEGGGRWELEEKDHCLLPKKIQLARFPSPLQSLKRLPCPYKAQSVKPINKDLGKKDSNLLMLRFMCRILNIF